MATKKSKEAREVLPIQQAFQGVLERYGKPLEPHKVPTDVLEELHAAVDQGLPDGWHSEIRVTGSRYSVYVVRNRKRRPGAEST